MKMRLFLSLLAFLFGGSVLIISLFSATPVSSTGLRSASENKLYFSKTILPDHVFYKAIMAMDRLQLETASSHERIFIQVEYAHRRLDYSQQLLEEGKEDLAITTLTKAEQYLHHAVSEANETNAAQSIKDRLKKAVEYHSKKLEEVKPNYTDGNRAVIDGILKEHLILIDLLKA